MGHTESRKRYREIAGVLAHHGFSWLWSDWGIGRILGKFEHGDSSAHALKSQPERLRLAFEALGTTFIKIGQMLSTRPDLLPPEYIVELAKLQDHVPVVSYEEISMLIEAELGGKPEDIFASFDCVARAAGSIAQVHNATLPDGTPVVVKVRRPGIEEQVEQDLSILGRGARFLVQSTDLGSHLDLEGLVEEFAFTIRNELDFVREGQNAERIAAEFATDPCLLVPKNYWDFSTHAVLTMDQINGIKIDDLDALDAAGIDRKKLANRCAHIALVQVLDHGFFHADPHPGNFFVMRDGVVGLIDYGMVGRLSDAMRESLVRLAMAISRRDTERLIDEIISIGASQGTIHRKALARDLDHLFTSYDGKPIGEISAAQVFRDVTVTAQAHSLRLPSDLIVLTRVIAMDEGMGANLDPDFNLLEFGQPYFKRFWLRNHSLEAMTKRLKNEGLDFADMGIDIPERLLRLMGTIERGELRVTGRLDLLPAQIKNFEQATNRIAISVLTAGLTIGLSVVTLVYRPAGSENFGYLVLKLLLAAAVILGGWLLYAFWKSTRIKSGE